MLTNDVISFGQLDHGVVPIHLNAYENSKAETNLHICAVQEEFTHIITTSLLSNAINNLAKVLKICYSQLSDHIFR